LIERLDTGHCLHCRKKLDVGEEGIVAAGHQFACVCDDCIDKLTKHLLEDYCYDLWFLLDKNMVNYPYSDVIQSICEMKGYER